MKRIATFILLVALSVAWSMPANAQRENRSIGENSREAKKAAKQQQKYSKKQAKKQRKAAKKSPEGATQGGEAPATSRQVAFRLYPSWIFGCLRSEGGSARHCLRAY
jgi:hypothetical protein